VTRFIWRASTTRATNGRDTVAEQPWTADNPSHRGQLFCPSTNSDLHQLQLNNDAYSGTAGNRDACSLTMIPAAGRRQMLGLESMISSTSPA